MNAGANMMPKSLVRQDMPKTMPDKKYLLDHFDKAVKILQSVQEIAPPAVDKEQ